MTGRDEWGFVESLPGCMVDDDKAWDESENALRFFDARSEGDVEKRPSSASSSSSLRLRFATDRGVV